MDAAQFAFSHEAELAKSVLDAADIPARIRDSSMVRLDLMFSNGIGAARVQVPEERLEEAVALLEHGIDALPES